MIELTNDLQTRLAARATVDKRRWWEAYLKGEAAFRGVGMPDVRAAVAAWVTDYEIVTHMADRQVYSLLNRLMEQPYTEDKLAATLLIQEHLVPKGKLVWEEALPRFATYFTKGFLGDWNSVDWFSVKALWALAERDGEACMRGILAWSKAPHLWQARAGVVAFANTASKGAAMFSGFPVALVEACKPLISRPDRFAKTAVGWTLRGLREAEPERVDHFVETHLPAFSLESLRSVLKHADPSLRSRFVAQFRAL